MRTEQEARDRVQRLLAETGLTDEAEKAVKAWQEASERHKKLVALGAVSDTDCDAYTTAFDTYWDVYHRAGVWTDDKPAEAPVVVVDTKGKT